MMENTEAVHLNTHDNTPPQPVRMGKIEKAALIIGISLFCAMFVLGGFVCIYYAQEVMIGIVVSLIPFIFAAIIYRIQMDMKHACVEIQGDVIRVMDYNFGICREKQFSVSEIKEAESIIVTSGRVKGLRLGVSMIRYIIFRGERRRYLFKIIDLPETRAVFEKYVGITKA